MALYLIRRNVPGIGKEDIDAASLRAISCAYSYEGLRWIQSYWDPEAGVMDCVWEAKDAEQVADHARRALLPCDEIREVRLITPGDFLEEPATETATA
jgi:hypothetical protein